MNPQTFGQLLSEGIYAIKSREGKLINVIEDELGYGLNRGGGSSISHWRRGHVPTQDREIETLARLLVERGKLDRQWLEKFCEAAGYPEQKLIEDLFGKTETISSSEEQTSIKETVTTLEILLAQQNYPKAVEVFVNNCEQIIKRDPPQKIFDLINQIPARLLTSFPQLSYALGLVYTELDQLDQAIAFLQKARTHYAQQADLEGRIKCYLELIRIYQKKEDFQTAYQYVQEADHLVEKTSDTLSRITFLIRLGELCPEVGKLEEGVTHLKQAVHLIRGYPDLKYEEFRILHLLSLIYRQLGQYRDAISWLEMAKQLYMAGGISPLRYQDLINSEAHIYWYMGDLENALGKAKQLLEAVDDLNLGKRRIYARILLGNLSLALSQHAAAYHFYEDAKRITRQEKYILFLPWTYSQQAWLHLLAENYVASRRLIFTALETADHGQTMSFNITLAILKILAEEDASALALLQKSQEFYVTSGDKLTVSIIHLYLAYIHYKTNSTREASTHVEQALLWFFNHNIVYFPLWWHPDVISQILLYALTNNIYAATAERMLVKLFALSDATFIDKMKQYSESKLAPIISRIFEIAEQQRNPSLPYENNDFEPLK